MKNVFYILLALNVSALTGTVKAQEVLSNQSVIDMVELGLGEDVITSKINTSDADFDTGLESLKTMKLKGVPSSVISLMIKKASDKAKVRPGIYYVVKEEKHKINPNVFSGSKFDALGYAFSGGIANAKTKAFLTGAQSVSTIKASDEVNFIFQFDPNTTDRQHLNTTNWWFQTASSPQEFVLTSMKKNSRKNRREIVVAKVGLASGGAESGIDPKSAIAFKSEKVGEGTYKVVPKQKLLPGEYCFFYKGRIPVGGYNNQSVFDFSIQ